MSTRSRYTVVLLLACLLGASALLLSQSAATRFEQGLLKENAEGTLDEAIVIFKGIAEDKTAAPAIRARAQLHLGICYEKLGDAQARGAYERLIASFPGQTNEVAAARARLAALKAPPRDASSVPTLRLVWSGTDTDSSGEVSPDGRLLAYVNWDTGNLAVRDLRSGQSRSITDKPAGWVSDDFAFKPRWSPDGKRIAYYWFRDDRSLKGPGAADKDELRVIDLSGKNVRVLQSQPSSPGGLTPIGWYPDGQALLATAVPDMVDVTPGTWISGHLSRVGDQQYSTEVVRVSMEDGSVSSVGKLGPVGHDPRVCLSPDGMYLAFDGPGDPDSLNMDVFVMPSTGGPAAPVVTGPYDDRLLAWMPDGRHILFASNRSGTYDAWLMQVDSGRGAGLPLLIRHGFGLVDPIGFAPVGAFYFAPNLAVRDVMIADWSPESQKAVSEPRLATEHFSGATRGAAWSPDGRKLAYLVDRGDRRRAEALVRIRDADTGNERTLAGLAGSVSSLSWSPDGRSVGMTVKSGLLPSVLQIVDANSGKVIREITTMQKGQDIWFIAWGSEGSVVYYVTGGGRGSTLVLRRDLHAGDETRLYTGALGVPVDVAVSADGQHIAVVHGSKVMVIAASGGEPRELVAKAPGRRVSDALAWSRDGRHLYFGRRVEGVARLYRVAVNGGAPEDTNLEIGAELRFRPDGNQLAFTRSKGAGPGEVWVIENFLPRAKEAASAPMQKVKK